MAENFEIALCGQARQANLLRQAHRFDDAWEWPAAEACSDEIIDGNCSVAEAYIVRARARRFQGKLDEAWADYSKAVELDPQNASAWLGRGAVTVQRASRMEDTQEKWEIMETLVYPDYKKASSLSPNDAEIGLSLLELEICLGKYRQAVGTTGSWWGRAHSTRHKMICAWLGAIALILARKPERKWSKFRDYLVENLLTLSGTAWCTEEMRQFVNRLPGDNGHDRARLEKVLMIYNLFLSHFKDGYVL